MEKSKKKNSELISLIKLLKEESWKRKAPVWRDLAKRLEKSSKNWAEVNISHIKRYAKKNDTIVIPGKLLGAGYIEIPVTVAVFKSSENAIEKIKSAGGKVITIQDLLKNNPKGTGVRIFK
jgi:large subunit ribosomal protein L18e